MTSGLAALDEPQDAEALHDLRLDAKRLRYVLDAGVAALGEPARTGAKAAKELQTLLGDLHDIDALLPRVAAHGDANDRNLWWLVANQVEAGE